MSEHPNLTSLRSAAARREIADAAFRVALVTAMETRGQQFVGQKYSATDVAKAAGMSRQRVYQILSDAQETTT